MEAADQRRWSVSDDGSDHGLGMGRLAPKPPKSGMLEIYKFIRIYDLFLLLLAIKIFCLKIQ
jgi:hypothetical protein